MTKLTANGHEVKHVFATDYEGNEFEMLVAFEPKKYNKGKLIQLEPIEAARKELNKYKSWEVAGEGFIHKSIYSSYGGCEICNHPSNKLTKDGICENCI